jgi:hypothetical protein
MEASLTRPMLEAVKSRRFTRKGSARMDAGVRYRSPEDGLELRIARSLVVAMLGLTILLVAVVAMAF